MDIESERNEMIAKLVPKHPIDPDLKAEWVKALRSGEYEQGEKGLVMPKHDDRFREVPGQYQYCCLGVLGVIQGDIKPGTDIIESDASSRVYGFNGKLFGTSTNLGGFVVMNDDLGWTFNQIADWIEANL